MIFMVIYHHEEGGGPRNLKKCLRVHSTFYFAAAPIIYGQPYVYDLGTFFLGADNPVPPHILAMAPGQEADILCIRHGNTKLPLLRHLRRLMVCPKQLKEDRGGGPRKLVRSLVQARDILVSLQKTLSPQSASQILPEFASVALGPALPWQYRIPNTNVQTMARNEIWHGLNTLLLPVLFSTGAHRKQVCYDDYHRYAYPRKDEWLNRDKGTIPATIYRHTTFHKSDYGGARGWRIVWGVANKVYVDFAKHSTTVHTPGELLGRSIWGTMSQKVVLSYLCNAYTPMLSWPGLEDSERGEIIAATSVEVYGLDKIVAFDREDLPQLDESEMARLDAEEAKWTLGEEEEKMRKERRQASRDLARLEKLASDKKDDWFYGGGQYVRPRIRLLRSDQAPPCPCCGYSPMTEEEYNEEHGSDRSWDLRSREIDDDYYHY
ncbi:hypothetical protein IAT38_005771 [Cryptococcus sp. DSM 104549]